MIPDDVGGDERLSLARRIVAERCLYGVDKNPLAAEMAKLSLWLVTLAKDRPFTFLDHALKCGDSLVGADEDMFQRWAHGLRGSEMTLFDEQLRGQLTEARAKRRELESFEVKDVRDAERKAALLAEANRALERVKPGCDLIIGVRLLDLKPKEKEARLNTLLLAYMAGKPLDTSEAREALDVARKVNAFHWPFEFPEMFERGGFSAFVGNPPFLGGKRISTTYGDNYHHYIKAKWSHQAGSADLCAYFFLRAFENLRPHGTLGLISTNTIAQGDTREVGLDHLFSQGAKIYNAANNRAWPGMAAVAVNIVHIAKGSINLLCLLDDKVVQHISSQLDSREAIDKPHQLAQNEGKSHMGTNVVGLGFMMLQEDAQELIARNPRNADVLFPYLNGEDLNSDPDQSPSRWIINFFNWPLEKAKGYPDCLAILREKVYPERRTKPGNYSKLWWQYGRRQERLYEAIAPLNRILVAAQTSKYLSISFRPKGFVYSHATIVIALDGGSDFAVLNSNFHEVWVRTYASTLETRLRYIPTDCFETFPFPLCSTDTSASRNTLSAIGETYHEHRRQIMLARQEGLTKTYNRFHDPDEHSADIARLRALHVEMDQAVAAAYNWDDLELGHGFHKTAQGVRYTISEPARREVLARLLELNHQRYEEEQTEDRSARPKTKAEARRQEGGQGAVGVVVVIGFSQTPERSEGGSDVAC